MKFLLDVCVSSRSLEAFLRGQGYDVLSVMSVDPEASDEYIMQLALEQDRILVTEDCDFGELVFVGQFPHGPIIRLVGMNAKERVDAMTELCEQYGQELNGPTLITASRGRIRIRRAD